MQPGQAEQYVGQLGERAVGRAEQEMVERDAHRRALEERLAAERERRAREPERDRDHDWDR
jgi:hypothetical protein